MANGIENTNAMDQAPAARPLVPLHLDATVGGRSSAAAFPQTQLTPLSAIPAEDALERLTNIIEIDPGNHCAHKERARLYMRQPHLLEFALVDIMNALIRIPEVKGDYTFVEYELIYAEILRRLGRHTEVRSHLTELLGVCMPAVRNGTLNPTLIIEGLNILLAEDPRDLLSLSRRAECYEKMRKFADAFADINACLAHAPRAFNFNMRLRKASLLKATGQFDAALTILDELIPTLTHLVGQPRPDTKVIEKYLNQTLVLREETLQEKEFSKSPVTATENAEASDSDTSNTASPHAAGAGAAGAAAHFATATTLGELSRIAGDKGARDLEAAPSPTGSGST